jgi:NADH dehydrogenase
MIASGKALIFGRGRNPINFVSAVDVARTIEHAVAAPIEARQTIEVPGPQNLTLLDLVDIVRAASGRSGSGRHIPRGMLRLLSVILRPVNRMRAQQIAAALAMDTREMAVDGPTIRAIDPSVPMTTAAEVAAALFGAARREIAASGSSNPGAASS